MADTIVCAVDQSEAAGAVFDTARWLADALQTRLVVVQVAEGSDSDDGERLASVRAQLGGEADDVRLAQGSPARAIMDTADAENAYLLVVGSRGRGSLRAAMLGSVSRELTAEARCPLVVVPPTEARSTASGATEASVVCGVDGSDEALAGAAFAGALATRLGYRVVVVHARQNVKAMVSYPGARSETPPATGQDDSVQQLVEEVMRRAVEATGVPATGVVEPGPPADVLESVAKREGARLIVVTARGLGGIRAALLGSVAAELTAAATRPVVVLSESASQAGSAGA
jgi:nucleotide-binding universal stress UspA family protein